MGDIADAARKWLAAPRPPRPLTRRCFQCLYFDQMRATDLTYFSSEGGCVDVPLGWCRKAPGERARTGHAEWPQVHGTDWCGAWEAAEPVDWDSTAAALARAVLAGDRTAALALADRLSGGDRPAGGDDTTGG